MYRKTSNVGGFKELEQVMQLKNVKKIVNSAGIGLKGIGLKIDRNPELFGKGVYGYTNGKPSSTDILAEFEKGAYSSGKDWWKYYNFINGEKR